MSAVKLPFATIDKQHIGQLPFPRRKTLVATLKRLLHGGVIVSPFDAFNIELAIIRLAGTGTVKYDTGGYCGFTGRVTDIKTLNAAHRLLRPKQRFKGQKALLHVFAGGQLCRQGLLGIGLRHVDPGGALDRNVGVRGRHGLSAASPAAAGTSPTTRRSASSWM